MARGALAAAACAAAMCGVALADETEHLSDRVAVHGVMEEEIPAIAVRSKRDSSVRSKRENDCRGRILAR
jgi:hypothetical protein